MATTKRVNRESEQTIGIILITGFVMLIVVALTAPSGAYSGPIEDRAILIDTNQGQTVVSKVFEGRAVVSSSAVMLMLASKRRQPTRSRPNTMAAIFAGAANTIGLSYIYILVTDPGRGTTAAQQHRS